MPTDLERLRVAVRGLRRDITQVRDMLDADDRLLSDPDEFHVGEDD